MQKDFYPSYKYLLIFIISFILLVIFAITFKIVKEVTTSSFKNNAFSVLFVAKDTKYVYVDKGAKKALFLALGDVSSEVKGKNNLGASLALGIPINAIVTEKSPPQNITELISSNREMEYLFGQQAKLRHMNKYDMHTFIGALKSTIKDNRLEKRVNLLKKEDIRGMEEYFVDSSIINEPVTVEIDNGTRINGLGNELAKVLARQGYNVIAVRTVQDGLTSYVASEQEGRAYLNSLQGITNFVFKKQKESQAADVTIFLGDDLEAMLVP